MKRLLVLIGFVLLVCASAADFWSINFDMWVGEISTATIGKTISLPIYVKNSGRIQDNYTVEVYSASPNIHIETPSLKITDVDYEETKVAYSKITLLVAAEDTNLKVTVSSDLAQQSGQQKSMEKILTIKSGLASLPDFDFSSIVQIMVLVSILLLFCKKV